MSNNTILFYVKKMLVSIPAILLGWLVIVPIVTMLPRRRDWVAVIGKHGGKFIDNGKYFFIQSVSFLAPGGRCAFISNRRDTCQMLVDVDSEYEVIYYPSWKAIWFLARTGVVVFESGGWSQQLRGYLLFGAKKVQLWHGVGFKKLTRWGQWSNHQVGNDGDKPLIQYLAVWGRSLLGYWHTYDLFNTTSKFYKEEVFEPAFESNLFSVTGYPRNAFALFDQPYSHIIWKNVDESIMKELPEWRSGMQRLVILAPTFRTDGTLPLDLNEKLVEKINQFGHENNIVFLFKFHPATEGVKQLEQSHIRVIDPTTDVYPLMPHTDALVTDYSSIYMDYLLLDRPVHFYMPDKYKRDAGVGQFQFDLNTMTPGPKTKNWDELLQSLLEQWQQDDFIQERAKLGTFAFDNLPQEDAVPAMLKIMQEQGWLETKRSANQIT